MKIVAISDAHMTIFMGLAELYSLATLRKAVLKKGHWCDGWGVLHVREVGTHAPSFAL